MADLIERLEAAEVGSRDLDIEVLTALGWRTPNGWEWIKPGGGALRNISALPRPSQSVDDALALAPERRGWMAHQPFDGPTSYAYVNQRDGGRTSGVAATPALALCVAILKARAALAERERP